MTDAAKPRKARKNARYHVQTDGNMDPMAFLELVMNDNQVENGLRVRAAITVAAYRGQKRKDSGKKGERADAAAEAAVGRFAPAAAPRLKVVGK